MNNGKKNLITAIVFIFLTIIVCLYAVNQGIEKIEEYKKYLDSTK